MLAVPLDLAPGKTAIIFEEARITYRELDRAANRVANGLLRLGVRPGDRTAVQLGNRPGFPHPLHSVTLLVLPLFHAFGLDLGVGLSLAFGPTMVLVERFNAGIDRHGVANERVVQER